MRLCKLRIAWSVGWGVVAVLLCVLWVRSYFCSDTAYPLIRPTQPLFLKSWYGVVSFNLYNHIDYRLKWSTYSERLTERELSAAKILLKSSMLGFSYNPTYGYSMPYWLPVLLSIALAAVPWLPRRFSLRTLLVATALIAVVLSIIVWMSRVG